MFMAALAVAGLAMQAYGQKRAGDKAKAAAEQQSLLFEEEAQYQEWRGKVREEDLYDVYRTKVGQIRVAYAKAGIRVDKHTALNIVKEADSKYQKDKAIIQKETGFNVRRARMGAAAALQQGRDAQSASYWQIGQTLMSGASQAYNQGWFSGLGGGTQTPYIPAT